MTHSVDRQSIWLKVFERFNTVPTGFEGARARVFLTIKFAGPIGILAHAAFVFVFWAIGAEVLALYNVISVIIFSFGFWRAFSGNLAWFFYGGFLFEIPLHALLATYYLGFETGYWLFIFMTVLFTVLYPALSRPVRFLLVFANIALMSVAMISAFTNGPIIEISSEVGTFLLVTNLFILALVIMVILASYDVAVEHAEAAKKLEFERAETLLLNILPSEIAVRLKAHEEPLADTHDNVSVLFADIAGFTNLSRSLPAGELITLLNDLFTRFDVLAAQYDAEKIKTIGDAYMVATGLRGEAKHAEQMADLAIGMQGAFDAFRREHDIDLKLRIGIHSGGVVAGVIGKQKFSYDLWGDTVNLASRMESEGVADRIQISAQTLASLPSRFETVSRGKITIKGHSPRECFLLEFEQNG